MSGSAWKGIGPSAYAQLSKLEQDILPKVGIRLAVSKCDDG